MLIIIICALLAFLFTGLSHAYQQLSLQRLRHEAKTGDHNKKQLLKLKTQGASVRITLELLRAIFLSAAIVATARYMWGWLAWLVVAVLFFLVFIVVNELYFHRFSLKILTLTTRPLLKVVYYMRPITRPLGRMFDRIISKDKTFITRNHLFDQVEGVVATDTDLSGEEVRIIKHALTFAQKKVRDIMTPHSVIAFRYADELLTPVVMDEIYKKGHSRLPVFSREDKTAVGILHVRDLYDIKEHQLVKDHMRRGISYVNEDRELDHVLQAFYRTKQQLFLVVDSYAEVVGLITIDDIISQILGRPILDEFDAYEDMRAVAEHRAQQRLDKMNIVS
jgi:CBS domain containing-hemolysin-like protein